MNKHKTPEQYKEVLNRVINDLETLVLCKIIPDSLRGVMIVLLSHLVPLHNERRLWK